jgi:large subunit ribosomal protein L13
MQQRTFMAKEADLDKTWYVIDAAGQRLGRLATQVAKVLRGKHKPEFTPHIDSGDYVIVINADKVELTGNKLEKKIYYRHSQYPGGLKTRPASDMLARHPEKVIELAVRGMLPHNCLGRRQLSKLKVYAGPNHPHAAQQPQPLVAEGR